MKCTALSVLLAAVCGLLSFLDASAAGFEVEDSVLVIPAGTPTIRDHAFEGRDDFHSVRFVAPVALKSIGDYAFLGCSNLRQIELPGGVSKLGQGCFRECESLVSVSLSKGISVIPRYCFAWCGKLKKVRLARQPADIMAHAFAYCFELEAFDFGTRLNHIGSNAFSFCTSLAQVSLPSSIKELESYAFSECVALTAATLPANSNLLGELIFSGCRNLKTITILSPVPPKFDCNSTLFEDNEAAMYEQCCLKVAPGCRERYLTAPGWSLFKKIDAGR